MLFSRRMQLGLTVNEGHLNLRFNSGLIRGRLRYSNSQQSKRTVEWNGILLNIEIDKGDIKSGIGEDGKPWSHRYEVPYGEIPNSQSLADGDGVDIYIAGSDQNAPVHVIHQLKFSGEFDEDKVILGVSNVEEAKKTYEKHGPSWGFGSMETMTWDQFENGYLASNRKL